MFLSAHHPSLVSIPTHTPRRLSTPALTPSLNFLHELQVFTNPYKEMAEEEATREAREKAREESEARERTEALNPGRWFSDPAGESRREEARRRGETASHTTPFAM